jgi:tetratricopeptide (TPR) repeat protein
MSESKLLKVFLCHASEDKPLVRELYYRLRDEGWMDVWLDVEKLMPGQDWHLEIEKAVEDANIVIACISSRSVDKEGYIQKELRSVLSLAEEKPEGAIFVIPLKLEDCLVPRSLQDRQWVNYYPSSQRDQAYQRLLTVLRMRAESLGILQIRQPGTQTVYSVQEQTAPPPPATSNPATDVKRIHWSIHPQVRPHAFVIMPFGRRIDMDGAIYEFNVIYSQLIKPALEDAGFEAFRVDEETTSGDIQTDMFQELLLADLCIADLSLDDVNVFYKMGIRHSLRKRGIVHIRANRPNMSFDVFNVRTLPYHITMEGVPDMAFLERDRAAIARIVLDTWASEPETIHSPVFNLLEGMVEPDRKTLRTPLARGFWREYNQWRERVTVAQRLKQIGDILLLTEEIQNPLIKEEAIRETGQALRNMDRHELALAQYRKGLEVNPRNIFFRQEEAFSLYRLGRVDEAIVRLEILLQDVPNDGATLTQLGRIYREMWLDSWKEISDREARLQAAFNYCHWLIKSFETYIKSFGYDLNNSYPGVSALRLGRMLVHLADRFDDKNAPDPEIIRVRAILPELQGNLLFALELKARDEKADYWTLISLAELRVLTGSSPQEVSRAYRRALMTSRRNQYNIQSSLAQLDMLRLLDLRPEFVTAGINILKEELYAIRGEKALQEAPIKTKAEAGKMEQEKRNRQVFLFTGYMMSHSGKSEKQLSPENEPSLQDAIQTVLDKYGAGPDDLAITTGLGAGSELIFVECCVERALSVKVYFPSAESPYIREFVSPCGETWVDRFFKMRNHPLVQDYYQAARVGLPREGDNLHQRNNRWALYSALAYGLDNVHLVAVWDGKEEPSSDLDSRQVRHMVDLVRDVGGRIEQIHPGKLIRSLPVKTTPKKNKNVLSPQRKVRK